MTVFLDTSALLAVLDAGDDAHAAASRIWSGLVEGGEELVSTNYVLVETFALVQRRLGMEAVRVLEQDILPLVRTHWVTETDHRAAVSALLTAGRRQLSLVDCVSFIVMRLLNLKTVFAFDQDFSDQGFEAIN